MAVSWATTYASFCETHGKESWCSRKQAKRRIRDYGSTGMREYRCDVVDGLWHIGRLPKDVIQGRVAEREAKA